MEEVVIEKLISNGKGMARDAEGRIVFVDGALPGERWRLAEVIKRKGSFWGRGERLEDAPIRTEPRCPHYAKCGGCTLLHVHPRFELAAKIEYVYDVLERVASVRPREINAVDFPGEASRIRGKIHAEPDGQMGFQGSGTHVVSAIEKCHVLPPSVIKALPKLARAVKRAGFEGEVYFMTDAKGLNPVFELIGSTRPGGLDPIRWKGTGAKGLVIKARGRSGHMKLGDTTTTFQWGESQVTLPPRAFLQSNPASWPVFAQKVRQYLKDQRPERVWDVHAGAGFLSAHVKGVPIWASEPDRTACDQLREGLKAAKKVYRVFQGTAEAAILRKFFEPNPADGLILDPPREGLSNELRQWIVDKGPNSLLYFSCDLGTFARDIRHLHEAYRMVSPLLAMNVNPGTLRLELGVVLTRQTGTE